MSHDSSENEWIEWSGGEQPIANGVSHEVRYRDGSKAESNHPETRDWLHNPRVCPFADIVAYRVVSAA